MQSYVLRLKGLGNTSTMFVDANFICYESGKAAGAGSAKIRVRHGSGEVFLKPGQSIRLPEVSRDWVIAAFDGVSDIDGFLILGFGEFTDANTENTVILDGEFANNVTVNNSVGAPVNTAIIGEVEVKNEAGNPLTVKVQGQVQTMGQYLAYQVSNSFVQTVTANVPVLIIDKAMNTGGIELYKQTLLQNGNVNTLVAKSSPPGNPFDGDLLSVACGAAGTPANVDANVIRIPSGKSVWLVSNANGFVSGGVLFSNM